MSDKNKEADLVLAGVPWVIADKSAYLSADRNEHLRLGALAHSAYNHQYRRPAYRAEAERKLTKLAARCGLKKA